MTRRTVSLLFVVFLGLAPMFPSPALARESVALISSLSGKVEVQRAETGSTQEAGLGDQIFQDDFVLTHKDARASLLFSDGSLITVSPGSRMKLTAHEMTQRKKDTLAASVSRSLLNGVKGLFSGDEKKEMPTFIAGIRKKVEEEEKKSIQVLYPRNSMILTDRPHLQWESRGRGGEVMISLTLKGMGGKLWSLRTHHPQLPYPQDQKALDRGQTYFLRIEREDDITILDEVFFMILDERKAREAGDYAREMEGLRKANPQDVTPFFILANYYRENGLLHEALEELEALEKILPASRFVLEGERDIYHRLGLWKKWEEVDGKLAR
jgi:hypothetical protein